MTQDLKKAGEIAAKASPIKGEIHGSYVAKILLSSLGEIKKIQKKLATMPQVEGIEDVQWFLDNWYLAEREGKDAAAILKHTKSLRKAEKTALILKLAQAMVEEGAGEVDAPGIFAFFQGVQEAVILDEKELSLLIACLKGALVLRLEFLAKFLSGQESPGKAADFQRVFTSLRLLSKLDFLNILDGLSHTEQSLGKDPAGVYLQMDEKTRGRYRRQVSYLAKKQGIAEHELAQKVLELARNGQGKGRHVGYYLINKPLGESPPNRRYGVYLGGIIIATLLLSMAVGAALNSIFVALILLVPISEIVKNLFDFFVIKFIRPQHLPRLALKEGVPPEGKTLCVISALLDSEKTGEALAKQLEEYYLANREAGQHLAFGILADFPESDQGVLPQASNWLSVTTAALEGLSVKYQHDFFLLHRPRHLDKRNNRHMGWERKRGAILELARLLAKGKSSFFVTGGLPQGRENHGQGVLPQALAGVRYVIVLDSDTRLNVGAAREMIGAMLHPLNQPVVNRKKGVVEEGYALMQPRIGIELEAANRSDFTRIFAGQGGIDPYGSAASDVYQDLFAQGSFAGKGIFDVAAFLACLDQTFPQGQVLSHDLLEGAYLRTGYLGDVELTDGYPYKVLSYFSRMHRWTRGDWQLLPWLFSRVPHGKHGKVKNPLGPLNRFKILDNLRRSMVPVFTMIALSASMFISLHSLFWAGVVAVLSPLSGLLISAADRMFRQNTQGRARYHSTIITGFAGGFLQTVSLLVLLPYHAWITGSAALLALWRMTVSRKNMLAWVTAAEMERKTQSGVLHHYYKMLPAVFLALFAILFSGTPFKIAVGIVWLCSPLYALHLSRTRTEKPTVTDAQKAYLTECAQEIWRYFEDFLSPQENYLPPDNWQEEPAVGIAHRTSPTNIGMALLSALAAIDLGLCPKEKAFALIENMLNTMETMDKWQGHLYNWYDTQTKKPLHPRYVSAVDSGNLSGCLLVLREGLYDLGKGDLAQQADRLYQAMDYAPLFDEKRKLFHIGYDLEKEALTEGWYDLLASEARQLSYVAIAKGDVEPRHWRQLGRAHVSQDGYSGMASWTGTMFEYSMPSLIMPCYPNSLIYESQKFCLYAQKKRSSPWGISESAFWAFDPALNYSYKAHGVQRLALKRGMNRELVISPYSSFLALPMDVKGAISNLKKLERYGARGKYGFYEALDFTPSRRGQKPCQLVKTYMVHHIGMSLLSIHGVLSQQGMARRFLKDRAMHAYRELLQEKVPLGQVVLRKSPKEVPDKPRKNLGGQWVIEAQTLAAYHPKASLLSNGAYRVLITQTGHSRSMAGEKMISRFEAAPEGAPLSGGFYWKSPTGVVSLQAAPEFLPHVQYGAKFTAERAQLTRKSEDLETKISITVPQACLGEKREVRIKNTGAQRQAGALVYYAEPVLQQGADYFAHPAFSKLSMESQVEENTIIFKRRGNGQSREVYWACQASQGFFYDTSREKAIGRSGLYAAMEKERGQTKGSLLDPCLLIEIPLDLAPGEEKSLQLAQAMGKTKEEAMQQARQILKEEDSGNYLVQTAQSLRMSSKEQEEAIKSLTALLYPYTGTSSRGQFITSATKGQRDLWAYGISGDLPIVTVEVGKEDELEQAEKQIKSHSFLRQLGMQYDLVFFLADSGDYRRPLHTGLGKLLLDYGAEGAKGAKGGIHFVDSVATSIQGAAAISYPQEETVPVEGLPLWKGPGRPVNERVNWSYEADGAVRITLEDSLPPNTWSQMLTNEHYGYIATECGTGHMWHKNARENKITPWENDTLKTKGAEQLCLMRDGAEISLFAGADGHPCDVIYGMGYASWGKTIGNSKITTTAYVPMDIDARVFLIEGDFLPQDKISYFAQLVLGVDDKHKAYVVTQKRGDMLVAQNGANGEFPGMTVGLCANTPPIAYSCDRLSWTKGVQDQKTGAGLDPCFYTVYEGQGELVIVVGADAPEALKTLANVKIARQKLEETKAWWTKKLGQIQVETGNENFDQLLSGWALYQSLACRTMGRSSVYQCGGAYGFRDQLQDSTAILALAPDVTKEQLLLAASHQFEEGDVQHWWHPTGLEEVADKGVRTRCSDDLLFLPYVLCQYVEKTGDMSICEELVPYIRSPILELGEHERYESPQRSSLEEDLFAHAKKAIEEALRRGPGAHGLALMGTGDWNDGMNLVGADGRGESVWLSWFLSHVLDEFSTLCTRRGETALAERYAKEAKRYGQAADNAWDGAWYLRGYYDNGDTLGSSKDEACQIDAIAQGWATMSKHSSADKVKRAILQGANRLFDQENKMVHLFDPPFDQGAANPGYIRGYAPGLRENGGQYTHGVLWLCMGAFRAGLPDLAYDMLMAMLPGQRDLDVYRGEPYVLAADVYGNQQHKGRAGWTWYTGAAGWYFRVALEELLGLKLKDGKLYIEPNLPKALPGYRVKWNTGVGQWDIQVDQGKITVNGKAYTGEGLEVFSPTEKTLFQNGKI